MKKNVIAIVAAVALVLLAVPTVAFANGMHQAWAPAGNAGTFAHHAMWETCNRDVATNANAAIATVRGELANRSVADDNADVEGQGICPGFVDVDGNGVCDNCTSDRGACPGYADADNDGVCDNYGTGSHHGNGNGNGCDINGGGSGNGGGHHGCMRR